MPVIPVLEALPIDCSQRKQPQGKTEPRLMWYRAYKKQAGEVNRKNRACLEDYCFVSENSPSTHRIHA
jgi:hypothetical protein